MYGFSTQAVTKRLHRQFGILSDKKSEEIIINCAVSQGSVRGPTLFNIYINGPFYLQLNGNLVMFMYVDDAIIIYAASNRDELISNMQYDLNLLSAWLIEQ